MTRVIKIKELSALRDKLTSIIAKYYDPDDAITVDLDYMLSEFIKVPKVNFDNMTVSELWQFFWHEDPPKDAHFECDRKFIVWIRDDYQKASITVGNLLHDFYLHPELFDENGRINKVH